ncbi:MAG: fatty acyl-AMP ligase, partial [Planctomycetota bacterium]
MADESRTDTEPRQTLPSPPAASGSMPVADDLWQRLEARVATTPTRDAFRFVGEDGEVAEEWSYADLHGRALANAERIRDAFGTDGPRLLVPVYDAQSFIAAWTGCVAAGAVAIPVPAPRGGSAVQDRLRAVAEDAGAAGFLLPAGIDAEMGLDLPTLEVVLDPPAKPYPVPTRVGGADLAVLQYTSGSTGDPKGVEVTHGNLLATCRDIGDDWQVDEESVQVCWLPLFHDLGLVCGIAVPIVLGMPCVLMTPEAFVRHPLSWLRLMSEHAASHAAGPNFAYELASRKVSPEDAAGLDLSNWRVALNAAETVRIATLRRMAQVLEPAGFSLKTFSPGYGLAESTAKVTAVECGRGPTTLVVDAQALDDGIAKPMSPGRPYRVLTRCGPAGARTDLRIVDPETREELPRRRVGEIWISSPSIARGYLGRPEATEAKFGARTASGDGPFLRTGDLAFLDGDGELVFVTRLADRIVLRGRNFDPGALEDACERAEPLARRGRGAAITFERDGLEHLGIVYEFPTDQDEQRVRAALRAMRRAVVQLVDLEPAAVVLAKPGSLPRTTSGKVRRGATAERLDKLVTEAAGSWFAEEAGGGAT